MCDHHFVATDPKQPIQLHRRDIVRGLWSGTMVLMGGSTLSGCATNPVTGRSQLTFMPSSQLVAMAAQAWAETKRETPISHDRAANARLSRIGEKIKVSAIENTRSLGATQMASDLEAADWEFVVFDTEDKNAFVLPGGKVGFYKGLLDYSDNDDQVAAVLGHEVGHVQARHSNERMSQQTLGQVGLVATGVAVSQSDMNSQEQQMVMAAAGAGLTLGIILPFSRRHELEADKLGVDNMYKAGYDPREAVNLWVKMGQNRSGAPPEWMSTHPSPQTRVRELTNYINSRGYALM